MLALSYMLVNRNTLMVIPLNYLWRLVEHEALDTRAK